MNQICSDAFAGRGRSGNRCCPLFLGAGPPLSAATELLVHLALRAWWWRGLYVV